MTPRDPRAGLEVPASFDVDVRLARARRRAGELRLMAEECAGFAWETAGWIRIGDAQLAEHDVDGARDTVARLRAAFPEADIARVAALDSAIARQLAPPATRAHVVLFTGHMVDAPDRAARGKPPRFPRTAAAQSKAHGLIFTAIGKLVGDQAASTLGIAAGACGGDILFHEACAELGIATEVYLLVPPAQFQQQSVDHGGPGWVARFQALCRQRPTHVLQESLALPEWLAARGDVDVWERANAWMLCSALAIPAARRTLITFYNPAVEAEGSGGTGHLAEIARGHGMETVRVDAGALLP